MNLREYLTPITPGNRIFLANVNYDIPIEREEGLLEVERLLKKGEHYEWPSEDSTPIRVSGVYAFRAYHDDKLPDTK